VSPGSLCRGIIIGCLTAGKQALNLVDVPGGAEICNIRLGMILNALA
jgi:hypothetical protein